MKAKTIAQKKLTIVSKKITNIILPIMTTIFENKDEPNVMFIEKGNVVRKTNIMYVNEYTHNYDMILYEWKLNNNIVYDNYILRFNNVLDVNDKFKISKVKFLAIELSVKVYNLNNVYVEEIHAIDFKKNNYYMVDNILFDKSFVKYWCNNILNTVYSENYEISFFDDKMDSHILTSNDSVKILYDDFEIISHNK
tara:strand:- start:14927 stop:15511 length:585 start_codon:yes stop_codon:yes gene_type:complete